MRFYLQRHQFYCGIDLHAKKMFLCVLDEQGAVVLHRNIPADPDSLRRTLQPSRAGLVIGVECMFSWYWLADWCREENIPFVLGHALYMKAIHGGKAKNDRNDSGPSDWHTVKELAAMTARPTVCDAKCPELRRLIRRRRAPPTTSLEIRTKTQTQYATAGPKRAATNGDRPGARSRPL